MSRYTAVQHGDCGHQQPAEAKRQTLQFTKMSALQQRLHLYQLLRPDDQLSSPEFLSIYLSDRHNGVGGDGVILICPSDVADAQMRMFNLRRQRGHDVRQRHPLRRKVPLRQRHRAKSLYITYRDTRAASRSCSVMTMNGKAYKVYGRYGRGSAWPGARCP